MAHFAELDENNIVKRVIVVDNKDTSDANGVEKEYIGAAFCERIFGGRWVQTSYNANKRKNYAGIGYTYDEQRDAFIPIKLFSSWILDEATYRWQPPVPMPNDGKIYQWNEETTSWNEITVTPE
jgi:hypothetical protein